MNAYTDCYTEQPITFNCWKHHAGFIKLRIQEYRQSEQFDFSSFRSNMLRIGDSLMDLYLGELLPQEILDFFIELFNKNDITDRDKFILWLNEEKKDYREIRLKDNSNWTLRLNSQTQKYIHIHPSRYSPFTIRVRGVTLKSAILYIILDKTNRKIEDNLQLLNNVRKDYLNQPPLKMISPKSALPRLILILSAGNIR